MSGQAARDVEPGESWAFQEHRSMADVMTEEKRREKATRLAEQLTDYLLPANSARREGFVVVARASLLRFAEWLDGQKTAPPEGEGNAAQ